MPDAVHSHLCEEGAARDGTVNITCIRQLYNPSSNSKCDKEALMDDGDAFESNAKALNDDGDALKRAKEKLEGR